MAGGQLYNQEQLLAPFTTAATSKNTARAAEQTPAGEPAAATRVHARADAKGESRYWWHAPDVVAAEYDHACDAYEDLNRWHGMEDSHGH